MSIDNNLAQTLIKNPDIKLTKSLLLLFQSYRNRVIDGENIEVPLATYHMKSSKEFIGRLLAFNEDTSESTALIHNESTDSITLINIESIEAISIQNTDQIVQLLQSFNRNPTKLGLTRKLELMSKMITTVIGLDFVFEIDWNSFKANDLSLMNLKLLLSCADDVFTWIMSDELSRSILIDSPIRKVKFLHQKKFSVSKHKDTILIGLDMTVPADEYLINNTLQGAIESVF